MFTSSLHQPSPKHQLSHVRPILQETFHYFSGSIEGVWTPGRRSRNCCVCVLNFGVFWNITSSKRSESRASRGEESPSELRGNRSARRSAVEERHCPIHHRPRAPRRAPVCEVPPAKGAQGERQKYRRGTRTTPVLEQAPRKASLEVEVTQIERGSHHHLPVNRDIIGSQERQEERWYVRYHRSRKRRGEHRRKRKHRPQRQRRGGTRAWTLWRW